MNELGLGSWIRRRAAMDPQRRALLFEDRSWTYAELSADIDAVAAGLRGIGVRPGDCVAYLGPNHPALLQSFFAAALLAAAFVPVNHRLAGEEIAFILDDSGSTVVLYAPEMSELVSGLEWQAHDRTYLPTAETPANPSTRAGDDRRSVEAFLDGGCKADGRSGTWETGIDPVAVAPDDVCQPARIEFRAELPRNPAGKVPRHRLAA